MAGARLWKLLLSKVAEALQEMLVLEASALKSCGSLARNVPFGSILLEKVAEASHEMLVLEAFCLKSCRSPARNARFGCFLLEKLPKPRTKCSFWRGDFVVVWLCLWCGVFGGGVVMFLVWCFYGGVFVVVFLVWCFVVVFGVVFR